MRCISVIALLSSIALGHANDSMDAMGNKLADKLGDPLSDKLVFRASIAPSATQSATHSLIQSAAQTAGLLEDSVHAKPGAKTAMKSGARGERQSIPASPLKPSFKVPSLLVESLQTWRTRFKYTPRVSADQVVDQVDVPDLHIPITSAETTESLGYLGRLSPFPGVLPQVAIPDEAARISIAGSTPTGLTPRETYTSNQQDLGDVHADEDTKKEEKPLGDVQVDVDAERREKPLGDAPKFATVSMQPGIKTIRFRIHKGEYGKIARAPINVTAQQILKWVGGPGLWELRLCTSEGDKQILPHSRLGDLNAAEPLRLKVVQMAGPADERMGDLSMQKASEFRTHLIDSFIDADIKNSVRRKTPGARPVIRS